MDIRQLQYFLAVVEHQGVTRAAKVLHLSQPSVSQAIRSLERELRVSLFNRVGRGLVLSSEGEALVEPARRAVRSLEEVTEIMRGVRQLASGRLNIAAMPALAAEPVAAWMGVFRRQHPSVTLNLVEVVDPGEVLDMVRAGTCEIGFATYPLALGDLTGEQLSDQYMVLVCPPNWDIDASVPIPLGDMGDIPLVVQGQRSASWRSIERELQAHGVEPHVGVLVEEASAVIHLVLSGAGATFMPMRLALQARRSGARICATEPAIKRHMGFVHRDVQLSPPAREFLDMSLADAARWIQANQNRQTEGMSWLQAGLEIEDAIWQARLRLEHPI